MKRRFQAGDPRPMIVTFFTLILICVSTPPYAWRVFLGYSLFLFSVAAIYRVSIAMVLKRSLVIIPFVAVVAAFIPFMRDGAAGGGFNLGLADISLSSNGILVFWNVLVKSWISVVSMTILLSIIPFPTMLAGLEGLKVPKILLMLAGFTYRYLSLFREEAARMLRAARSRGYYGRWIWQAGVIGRMAGSLFLRSYERGERVYVAMLSRGYDGTLPSPPKPASAKMDYALPLLAISLLVLLRVAI